MVFVAIHDYFEKNGDPRIRHYLFMSSIWKPVSITIGYMLLVQVIGPWYMKNRKPYNIKKIIMFYNLLQVVLNSYITAMTLHAFLSIPGISSCIDIDYTNSERGFRELNCGHLYFMLKILDGMDTIFFVLRKSYRQMSFLHIYHHAAMMILSWVAAKYFGGGQSGWICLFNSTIHIFMYAYYFATICNPKYKEISMKKLMTQLQLVQFVLILYFYGYSFLSSCKYSKPMSALCVSQSVLFIYLFGNFYYHTYLKCNPGKTMARSE